MTLQGVESHNTQRRRFSVREYFVAVADFGRVHHFSETPHEGHVLCPKQLRQEFSFFHTDTMFSGNRSTAPNAQANDLRRKRLGFFKLTLDTTVEEDQGMQVSIARVKDIGDSNSSVFSQILDLLEYLPQFGARNNTVLNQKVLRQQSDR